MLSRVCVCVCVRALSFLHIHTHTGSYLEGAPVKPGQEPDELTFDDFERVIRRFVSIHLSLSISV